MDSADLVMECTAWKATSSSAEKSWLLDRSCKLEPEYAQEIVAEKRTIRPPGTWTVTAKLTTVTGSGQEVLLYSVTIHWPASFIAKGYTSLTFGFESVEEAAQWHSCVQQQLSQLRLKSSGGAKAAGHSPSQSYDEKDKGLLTAALEHLYWFGPKEKPAGKWGDLPHRPKTAPNGMDVGMRAAAGTQESKHLENAEDDLGSEYMASSIVRGLPDECLDVLMHLGSHTTILGPASRIQLLEDGAERQVLRITVEATGMARRLCSPREVVVERLFKREDGGVDVILFSSCQPPDLSGAADGRGSRLPTTASFASLSAAAGAQATADGGAISHAAAAAVPAVVVAVLAAGMAGLGHWDLRLLVAAASWVAMMLSLLVVWLLMTTADGGTPAAGKSGLSQRLGMWLLPLVQLWHRPVPACVQGGYTISPREDGLGPECLVTCILKVDLGGCLGERSWLRPFADALGWVDAYVERMLMAVILVKDEVEQRRFLVQPFSILSNQTAVVGSGAGEAGASQRLSAEFAFPQMQQQPTLQLQHQLSMLRGAAGFDRSAAAGGGRAPPQLPLARIASSQAALDAASGELSLSPALASLLSAGGAVGGVSAGAGAGADTVSGCGAAGGQLDDGALLASLGLPAETVVVDSQYYIGGPNGPAAAGSTLNKKYWSELHTPGTPAPFKVRSSSYLEDRTKVEGGIPQFVLGSVDLVETPGPVQHISRFLPAVSKSVAPGASGFAATAAGLGDRFEGPGQDADLDDDLDSESVRYIRPPDTCDWQPFDYALHRFLHGGQATRTAMLKLVPHIAEGSWVIKQSVGTVPVIVGNKLRTVYYQTDRYIEATVDVTSSSAAAYITGMVRGATKSLVIDLGFVLEGQQPEELPEALLGEAALLVQVSQALQQRCRNSMSVVEGGRTMTGHSHSRSAASVEELLHGGPGGLAGPFPVGCLPPHKERHATASGGATGGGGVPVTAGMVGCLPGGTGSSLTAAAGPGQGPEAAGTPAGCSSSSPLRVGVAQHHSPAPLVLDAPAALGETSRPHHGADPGAPYSIASMSAASPPVVQCRAHHRAGSAADLRGTPVWSASPPTADCPGKLSAAAYISRAHAAALAASAQKQQQQPHAAGAAGVLLQGAVDTGDVVSLPARRQRTSSTSGVGAVQEQQVGTDGVSGVAAAAMVLPIHKDKLSAVEQLRLTQSSIRTPSAPAAAQQQYQQHHSSITGLGQSLGGEGAGGSPRRGVQDSAGRAQAKAVHRRFASLGAVQ
eukprot:gene8904-9081_t